MNTEYGKTMDFVKGLKEVTRYQFETYNIDPSFPADIARLQASDFTAEECTCRKDFREEKALTIDCEDCKDIDDAVSVIRTSSGYRLAVHIADVAAYVPLGSELDQTASYRATSIYLPHLTVPMLPKALSNDLCSLNPGTSRYTLSVIAHLNENGDVIHSEITKGLIRSRVKGVYTEINTLLSGAKDIDLMEKYREVYEELLDMADLYKVLRAARIRNGATVEDSNRPKISVWKHSIKLTPTKEGIAENMIEEFMILANRIVAEYLYENELPAIFRIQEEKNHMAAYQPVKMHHAELALESYSHFTSPIRRIVDLKIHQILTMHLNGWKKQTIHDLFDEQLVEVCDRATKRSRTVKQVQEKCERYCYEQYFQIHRNDSYTGKLVGFDRKDRPIIQLNKYNVKVIGYAIINGSLGEQYSFKVGVSNKNNELFTSRPRKVAA